MKVVLLMSFLLLVNLYSKVENLEIVNNTISKAWKTHNINDTLKIIYGEDVIFATDKKVYIAIEPLGGNGMSLSVKKKSKSTTLLLKSMVVLVEDDLYSELIIFNNFDNIKSYSAHLTYEEDSFKNIVIVVKTNDEKYYIYKKRYPYFSCPNQNISNIMYSLYASQNEYKIENVKVIHRSYKNRKSISFSIFNLDFKSQRLKNKNKNVNFISSIVGKIKNKILFETYLGGIFPKALKMSILTQTINKYDKLNIVFTDTQGKRFDY